MGRWIGSKRVYCDMNSHQLAVYQSFRFTRVDYFAGKHLISELLKYEGGVIFIFYFFEKIAIYSLRKGVFAFKNIN